MTTLTASLVRKLADALEMMDATDRAMKNGVFQGVGGDLMRDRALNQCSRMLSRADYQKHGYDQRYFDSATAEVRRREKERARAFKRARDFKEQQRSASDGGMLLI
jgi:hypothetical protein